MTITELGNKLATMYDEVTIMELLEIDSFSLVKRYADRIEENYDYILSEVEVLSDEYK